MPLKQVVQDVRSGVTGTHTIPAPTLGPQEVLVAAAQSLVSAGTERYVVDLARKSLFGKARARPDQVRRVLEKVRDEGLLVTAQQVRAKLDEPMPLGYSAAGLVLACGQGAEGLKAGDRVAAAVPHAEIAAIGENLCARVPDGVSFQQAAYTSVAAIGLQGVRLAGVQLGEAVLVIGLGLIGQICVALLKAQGCRVFGTDIDPAKLDLARLWGRRGRARLPDRSGPGVQRRPRRGRRCDHRGHRKQRADRVRRGGAPPQGADRARRRCRPEPPPAALLPEGAGVHGVVVAWAGRGDRLYEEKGIDYPIGHARWTAKRNMEAVLDLMAQGKLPVERLTTHRFPIERAAEAYDLITSRKDPFIGILLEYPPPPEKPMRRLDLRASPAPRQARGERHRGRELRAPRDAAQPLPRGRLRVPWPLHGQGDERRAHRAALGVRLCHDGRRGALEGRGDPGRLHRHAARSARRAGDGGAPRRQARLRGEAALHRAGGAGRHRGARRGAGGECPLLTVGFNRRFAPATRELRRFFEGIVPLSVSHRFSPGAIPPDHWTQDEEVGGGRIVGEACHAIDTCTAIVGSPPVRVFAESVAKVGGLQTTDDRVFITLRHADGSISNVSYQGAGDRAAPSERVEVFGDGRTGCVEGWDRIDLWVGGGTARPPGARTRATGPSSRRSCRAVVQAAPGPFRGSSSTP